MVPCTWTPAVREKTSCSRCLRRGTSARPLFKPSTSQLLGDLDAVQGLLVLDAVTLDDNAAQQLLLALPKCHVVVCSEERVLWHGTSLPLHGLERNYALAVIEQELGGPLPLLRHRGGLEHLQGPFRPPLEHPQGDRCGCTVRSFASRAGRGVERRQA